MTVPHIHVQLLNLEGVSHKLEGLEKALADLTPFWEGVVDPALREMWKQAFQTAGNSFGEHWPELSETTLKLKGRRGRAGMGILRDSNDLYRSLVFKGDPQGLRVLEPQRAVFGTRVPYAGAHQDGIPAEKHKVFGRPGKGLPKRRLVPADLPADVVAALKKGAVKYATEGLA